MDGSDRQHALSLATERMIAWFRIVGGAAGIVLTVTDQVVHPPLEHNLEVASLALLALVGVGTLRWLRREPDAQQLHRYMVGTYTVDSVVLLAQVPLHAFVALEAPSPALLVPLLGAVRFGYPGAVPGVVGVAAAYVLRGAIAVRVYGLDLGVDPAVVTVLLAAIIGLITAHLLTNARRGQADADRAAAEAETARARTAAVHRVLADGVGGGVAQVAERLAATVRQIVDADRVRLHIDPVDEVAGAEAEAEAGATVTGATTIVTRPVCYGDTQLGTMEVTSPRRLATELDEIADQVGVALNAARLLDHEAALSARYRALDAMRTNFVTLTSHELRTPVTGVIGATETLLARVSELSSEHARQLLELVARQGDRMHQLVEDLSQMGRSDAGVVAYRTAAVEVDDLVGAVEVALDRPVAHRSEESVLVWVDPDRTVQVLLNLVDNAYEHGVEPVTVRWGPAVDGTVRIAVSDAGEGIAPEDRDRVFERFVQLGSIQHHSRGTGLGLCISRDMARAMGGDVRYDPDAPTTTFVLELPAPPVLLDEPAAADAAGPVDHAVRTAGP